MENVVSLKTSPKSANKSVKAQKVTPKPVKSETTAQKKWTRQARAAIATGAVSLALTGLSFTHLADGIAAVTGAEWWPSAFMAIGIDGGFIAAEMAALCGGSEAVKRELFWFTTPIVIGSLIFSAILNSLAFLMHTPDNLFYQAGAVMLGVGIPAMVYGLSRVTFILGTRRP